MNENDSPLAPSPFPHRLDLALSHLAKTFCDRGGIWTDSDLMDTADLFTTDPQTPMDEPLGDRYDHMELTNALETLIDDYLVAQGIAERIDPSR